MQTTFAFLKKYLSPLFHTRAAGIYILLFALAIGAATFIENDFGTSAAQKVVYQAWWFELLLFLFGVTIIVNIFRFRMIPQKKWALLLFHAAIIVILLGSAITRYFSYEGMMHIRENSANNQFLSSQTYLTFKAAKGEKSYDFDEPVLFASLGNNHWEESFLLGSEQVDVRVKEFIPNPKAVLYESLDGKPMLQIVIAGQNGREEYFLEQGQAKRMHNLVFNFKPDPLPDAVNIVYRNDSLLFNSSQNLTQTVMATQQRDTIYANGTYHSLALRALYTDGVNSFVCADFKESGKTKIISEDPKVKNESLTALLLEISSGGQGKQHYVYGQKGVPGKPATMHFGDLHFSVAYGAREIELPFSIHLYDFIMDKYPGTNSAASYASEVQLIDPRSNHREDYRIYMNNILNYQGFRFFQSSFDRDEKGTYLSVNHDFWGTWVSYLGYALLTLGMVWTLFSKRTRFYQVRQRLDKLRAKRASLILVLLGLASGISAQGDPEIQSANSSAHTDYAVARDHAQAFSQVIVQDFKGRMKPVHTLSREILRKIARQERFDGLNADQVLLGLFVSSKEWSTVPLIKLGKHKDIKNKLGVAGDYAAYTDFFTESGQYKLRQEISRVHSLAPIDRGTFEKELLKIDERLNILGMAFSGGLLRIIPQPEDPNHTWLANHRHNHNDGHEHNHSFEVAEKFFNAYRSTLREAISTGDYQHAEHLLDELKSYQQEKGGAILPSPSKIRGEIMLNNSRIFSRLTGLYLLLGVGFLCFLFLSVFKPTLRLNTASKVLFAGVLVGFVLHTLGLAVRWYVSGRAPWSNGYESMIYIAWTTTLAGVLFSRKSSGGLAATMVLAATILFVATLSFLDPEITPLVPVLRSYWLTIHVSLEAGSYGFLMLGAIIGLINLILMALIRESNLTRTKAIIQEMSYLSEMTLTAGLFMISIGTFLGGVWANESWGRYWGWDAKETWALVTILIYAFILHMRLIPRLFGLFSYNLSTIFGLASVVMTYYGVNYYLSGLHSYATGDPVPIPTWVYVFIGVVTAISGLAYWKKRRFSGIS